MLKKKNKYKYFILQFHIFFSSILETLSIFSIIPILESFNASSQNKTLDFLENYIELKYLSPSYLIIFFCLFLILSNIYLMLIKKKITNFSFELMLELQKKIFHKAINRKYEYFINKDISFFNNMILHESHRLKSGFIESSLFICNSPIGSLSLPTCLTPLIPKSSLSFDNFNLDKRALEIPFSSAIL